MAFELLVLFRAFSPGPRRGLWLLIPTSSLWANIDESFLTGLVVLAAAAVGRGSMDRVRPGWSAHCREIDRTAEGTPDAEDVAERRPVHAGTAFIILACCAAACLVNPYTYRAYAAALIPYTQLLQPTGQFTTVDQLSFFGRIKKPELDIPILGMLVPTGTCSRAYYLVVVALGLGSFLAECASILLEPIPAFAVMAVFWGLLMHFSMPFRGRVRGARRPNGQEWYHDRLGPKAGWVGSGRSGRPAAGW